MVETLREKIISLELSNAEDEIESITGTGASDAESESEEITVQPPTMTTLQERNETIISTSATEGAAPKISANTVLVSKKKETKTFEERSSLILNKNFGARKKTYLKKFVKFFLLHNCESVF